MVVGCNPMMKSMPPQCRLPYAFPPYGCSCLGVLPRGLALMEVEWVVVGFCPSVEEWLHLPVLPACWHLALYSHFLYASAVPPPCCAWVVVVGYCACLAHSQVEWVGRPPHLEEVGCDSGRRRSLPMPVLQWCWCLVLVEAPCLVTLLPAVGGPCVQFPAPDHPFPLPCLGACPPRTWQWFVPTMPIAHFE